MIVADHNLKGIGPDRVVVHGSFAPNGASNPLAASSRGREHGNLFTVTYAPTGIYTVTFPQGYTLPSQPMSIIVSAQCDTFANWFEVINVGETTLNTTTRTIVIQAHRNGVANAPAAAAGCRINFLLVVSNNTGT